jgi:hypothetical protein
VLDLKRVRGWCSILFACALLWGSADAFALRCVTSDLTPEKRGTPVLDNGVSRARYFDPQTGRFWTMEAEEGQGEDPLSLHKYLYCYDNPVNVTNFFDVVLLAEVPSQAFRNVARAGVVKRD